MDYEPVIGLEVHVQLRTETKIFCRCPNLFGADPNTLICPVCLGYPGSLPVLNLAAVDLAVKLALALGCTVHPSSIFARKNYFYADLPKGYQISQFEHPIAVSGSLPLSESDHAVIINRLHLEEDAGKLLHEVPGGAPLPGKSLVDFNRCGVPLVEIVSEPDITSAHEAQDYLQTLHRVLLYTGTSDGNMEEGSLRCDANVSVRPRGSTGLGTKVEVKNLNSFRHVARAVEYEIERQTSLLESGAAVVQETRSFDAGSGGTKTLRSKEEAHDYRYFPEPDLRPLVVSESRIERLRRELPELPWDLGRRFVEEYELSRDDATLLVGSPALASYFEEAVRVSSSSPRVLANWVRTEVLRELKGEESDPSAGLPPERLGRLVALVDEGRLSVSAAKAVFAEIWSSQEEPEAAMQRLGLDQVRDRQQIEEWVVAVVAENAAAVEEYRSGKSQVLGFLVGRVMRLSAGRAEPRQVQELLREAMASGGRSRHHSASTTG
jgi:aspartyl-tRNA(Asn)/glutamyl-tRNA(Gln) amidotransferase subunit B